MAFIIGLIGMICLGKAVFMGWLHKSEWKLLRITDPGRWWKLQIKQAVWAAVGIVLIFIYGELSPDKGKKPSGSTQSAPTEQTVTKDKGKKGKQKRVEQQESTSSYPKEETEYKGTSEIPNQESEEAEETNETNLPPKEDETSDEPNENDI